MRMLPLPADQPPPCALIRTEASHTTPSLLAEPGCHKIISDTSLLSSDSCAILARSTAQVGCLASPIQLNLNGCTLGSVGNAPIFLISNARVEIKLTNCRADASEKHLISAQESIWGKPGFNAGSARITVVNSTLKGNIYVGKNCKIELTLSSGSCWHGHFTGPGKATLDKHPHAIWIQNPHNPPPHPTQRYAILEKKSP